MTAEGGGVASLAAAEANGQLPLVVERVFLDGGEVSLTLSGEDWSFSTLSSWRVVRVGRFVCSSSHQPARVVTELDGASLIDASVRPGSVDDLTLAFAGGLVLEVFSEMLVEPWVLTLPRGVFVPSDIGQSGSSMGPRSAESLSAVRGRDLRLVASALNEVLKELTADESAVRLGATAEEVEALRQRLAALHRREVERAAAASGRLSPVELPLGRDAALVLFEALAAESLRAAEGSAEATALFELEASLERALVEPFRSDYRALLDAARARLAPE